MAIGKSNQLNILNFKSKKKSIEFIFCYFHCCSHVNGNKLNSVASIFMSECEYISDVACRQRVNATYVNKLPREKKKKRNIYMASKCFLANPHGLFVIFIISLQCVFITMFSGFDTYHSRCQWLTLVFRRHENKKQTLFISFELFPGKLNFQNIRTHEQTDEKKHSLIDILIFNFVTHKIWNKVCWRGKIFFCFSSNGENNEQWNIRKHSSAKQFASKS